MNRMYERTDYDLILWLMFRNRAQYVSFVATCSNFTVKLSKFLTCRVSIRAFVPSVYLVSVCYSSYLINHHWTAFHVAQTIQSSSFHHRFRCRAQNTIAMGLKSRMTYFDLNPSDIPTQSSTITQSSLLSWLHSSAAMELRC